MSRLETLLTKISEDSVSGSSEIYSDLLKELLKAVAERPSSEDWRDFSDGLSRVKRSMAPVQNVAGSLRVLLNASIPEDQLNGFVKGFLNDLMERERRAADVISNIVKREHEPRRVVTLSYSSTVMAALSAMPKDVEVSVAESLPLGEGVATYRRLVEKGMKASLFRDSMIPSEVAAADLVLVGADGVCPEGVVNKVGTRSLAMAAKEQGIPMVALCSTSKLIPVLDMDPMSSTRTIDGLRYRERVFEITPLRLFHSIITEEGAISGEEMEKRLVQDRSKMKLTECQGC
jgi:translation initiation factor 2B subunit (eIF-2B alpha/beta/delta family)